MYNNNIRREMTEQELNVPGRYGYRLKVYGYRLYFKLVYTGSCKTLPKPADFLMGISLCMVHQRRHIIKKLNFLYSIINKYQA